MSESPVGCQLRVRQAVSDAASDVDEGAFFSETQACRKHAYHTKALADVGLEAEHVWKCETSHDRPHLRNTTASSLSTPIPDDALREPSKKHAH